jgi:hypothetical protein
MRQPVAAELVRVAIRRRFAFSLHEGYAYITDLARWPEYWPGFVRLAPESRWSKPGDTAALTLRLLGRETELEMTLLRIEPYSLVEYTSVQRGLPAAHHERRFAEDPAGFGYEIAVALQPRSGLRGPFDRLVVSRAVERASRQTVRNLERRFAELRAARETARRRPTTRQQGGRDDHRGR